jgi:fluoride exporter
MTSPSLPLVLLFAVAGAAGALARWGIYELVVQFGGATLNTWHFGTAAVNLLGCFAYGVGYGMLPSAQVSSWRLIFLTGFLGAFTTFSAFAADTLQLAKDDGLPFRAIVNVVAQVVLGLLLLWLGIKLTSR